MYANRLDKYKAKMGPRNAAPKLLSSCWLLSSLDSGSGAFDLKFFLPTSAFVPSGWAIVPTPFEPSDSLCKLSFIFNSIVCFSGASW